MPESLRELVGGRWRSSRRDRRCSAGGFGAGAADGRAGGGGPWRDGRVRESISAAAADEIVELDDSRVRFAHPLLASICYERAPIWKRRAVHRHWQPWSRPRGAGPSSWRLRRRDPMIRGGRGAGRAPPSRPHAAGATAAAAELCELAASLTPRRCAWRGGGVLAAAHYHRLAGDLARAAADARGALARRSAGVARADVLLELFGLGGRPLGQIALFEEALGEAAKATTPVRHGSCLRARAAACGHRTTCLGARGRRASRAREGRARRRSRSVRGR